MIVATRYVVFLGVEKTLTVSTNYFRTLLVPASQLDHAKMLLARYKRGEMASMTAELWRAKKIVDSTLHPGTSFHR